MTKRIVIAITMNTLMAFSAMAQTSQTEDDYWTLNYSDPFLEPTCPLMDAATMWILRQKITTRAVETIVHTELAPPSGSRGSMRQARLETYATVVDAGSVSSLMGFKYFQSDILPKNQEEFGNTFQDLWFWNATKYVVSARTNLMMVSEYYRRGVGDSFQQKAGDEILEYLMYDYALSKRWQIMLLATYDLQYMSNKRTSRILPAAEVRWEPDDDFKLVFGVPVIAAFEWSITRRLGLAAKYSLGNEVGAFLRCKVSNVFSISLVYDRSGNGTVDTYFSPRSYSPTPTETSTYTNLSQMTDQISLDFGILTSSEVALNIAVGYSKGEDIQLNNNLDKAGTVAGVGEYFVRLQLHHLNIWK